MAKISLVAAVDEHNGLGYRGQLLCHLPADLKYFKQLTLGKPIIMGRATYESIGKPLPGRLNIVLTRQAKLIAGVEVVHSLEEALVVAGDVPEIMIIGGADIFHQALPLADKIYLTQIQHTFTADVFFPELNEKMWHMQEMGHHEADTHNACAMKFFMLSRTSLAT